MDAVVFTDYHLVSVYLLAYDLDERSLLYLIVIYVLNFS